MKTNVLFCCTVLVLCGHFWLSWQWLPFFNDPAPLQAKAWFLASSYGLPFIGAVAASFTFQLVGRISQGPQPSKRLVFSMAVIATALMWGTFLYMGAIGRPAYLAGMGAGVTLSTQLYAITMHRYRWLGEWPRLVWRWNGTAVREFQELARSRGAAR